MEGEVVRENGASKHYSLVVYFVSVVAMFKKDGRIYTKQTTPCLKLIKPKKKVYQWSYRYPTYCYWYITPVFYADEKEAKDKLPSNVELVRLDHTMKDVEE